MPQPPEQIVKSTQSYLSDLFTKLAKDEIKYSTGMHYGEQSKRVSARFEESEHGAIELLHITDVQFGHVECRMHRVKEYRDWVLASPNRYMIWGGDMVDAWTMYSPGRPWEQVCGPSSQVAQFCEFWAPARHRIIGYVGGNHERRGIPTFGDLGVLIATLLRIPYSEGQQLIDIHYGKHQPFKIHLWHGKGSAQTMGAKAQMLHRFMQSGDSQLYLVGHLHDAIIVAGCRSLREANKLDVHVEKIFGAMSSSFLSYWGTYSEVKGLSVSDVLMARAVLEPSGKWELTLR